MCTVMAGLAALGGFTQYRQQKQAADAQASMYNAQAQAAEQNARVESRKQEQIADNYAEQSRRLRSKQRLSEGAQRAQTGAAGLNFAGSSMDILSSGLQAYNDDQNTLLSNQRNDNYGSRVAQTNYINQANNYHTAASNVKSQSRLSTIGTILGTAASVYGLNQSWKSSKSAANSASDGFTIGETPSNEFTLGGNASKWQFTTPTPRANSLDTMGLKTNKYGYVDKDWMGW